MLLLIALAWVVSACVPVQAPAETVVENTSAQVTEVIPFDPVSIEPASEQQAVAGTCAASLYVPRQGAYRCTTGAGAIFDPCFVLEDSGTLGCKPNPAAGTYSALVTAEGSLPAVEETGKVVAFFLNLGAQKPTCSIGTSSPLEFDDRPVTFACAAPGAWVLGPLRVDQPAWQADYIVTDSNVTSITYGPEATFVVQAWVY